MTKKHIPAKDVADLVQKTAAFAEGQNNLLEQIQGDREQAVSLIPGTVEGLQKLSQALGSPGGDTDELSNHLSSHAGAMDVLNVVVKQALAGQLSPRGTNKIASDGEAAEPGRCVGGAKKKVASDGHRFR